MATDISRFVAKTISLLNLERRVEIEETRALQENISPKELQKRGVCLLKLRIRGRRTGLYGRTLLTFEVSKPGSDGKLPSHSLTPGDIVGLGWSSGDKATDIASGIVSRVIPTAITVAFDDTADNLTFDYDDLFRLVRLANDITHKRLKSALDGLSKYREGPASHLIDILFGNQTPGPPLQIKPFITQEEQEDSNLTFFNPLLDESQKQAVRFALCQREVAIIHGPPGTGKTTTVVEIILQAVKNLKMKVLACAPSNVAVDNMAEKLVKSKARVVRIGHPARLLSVVQEHCLDALLSNSDATGIVQDVRKDIDDTLVKVKKSRNPSEKKHLKQEMKSLKEELKQRENQAIRELLAKADVVLATNTSASSDGPLKLTKVDQFDLVVIDEVAQSLEAGCWIPLLHAPRCVLAGDHLQLPPTILSSEAAKRGLEVTLMERGIKLLGSSVVRMLTTQYRMNAKIMRWSSEKLYGGQLKADPSVESHLLKDLAGVQETDETSLPLLLVDTTGCDVMEMEVEDEVSKGNEGEADIVAAHVTALITSGIDPSDIAVIAPYNLQVEMLRMRLSAMYPTLEIKSVDGFQGREKEAVVISLVRSNKKGEVGFLAEHRRINVAITRARRHLAVVADSETMSHDQFLKSLMEYMSDEGEVRSAHEYLQECVSSIDQTSFEGGKTVMAQGDANRKKEIVPERANASPSKNNRFKENLVPVKFATGKNRAKKTTFSNTNTAKDSGKTEAPAAASGVLSDEASFVARDRHHHHPSGELGRPFLSSSAPDPKYDRETLEKEIAEFTKDSTKIEVAFPTSLNSQQRFDVHSIAEQLGLGHESKGEAEHRYIVVKKCQKAFEDMEEDNELVSTCPTCKKRLPTCNMQLHQLRCEQLLRCKTDAPKRASNVTRSKPPKSETKSKPSCARKYEEEDFDKLLSSFSKMDSRCAFDACKQSVRTLGQKCNCCERTFCLSHHTPEVHGCGNAAKLRARYLASKPNSAKPKALDATRKAQLHRKLDKKLDEMSDQRKAKKRENKE